MIYAANSIMVRTTTTTVRICGVGKDEEQEKGYDM